MRLLSLLRLFGLLRLAAAAVTWVGPAYKAATYTKGTQSTYLPTYLHTNECAGCIGRQADRPRRAPLVAPFAHPRDPPS
ncbi:uncharacterized protein GGS25DRAFT_139586 [Hypoxylon fragiforme]|uniref:uncharacterized protein n=1 Tax=Hypoxylon fragiforme TaxID=63214 RepID=UPI0020C69D6B|nr:uncharacterized protein GGS25DRAFT_139586 [Hypoxylon fragiforme]KAI2612871.1 hypothetical protein GGS25DRAFT_139586 [Hypoxylon fragiforme]